MGGAPVGFQVFAEMFASVGELILVQNHVEAVRGAVGQFLGHEHLRVHEFRLRLAARLDQATQYFLVRYLEELKSVFDGNPLPLNIQ